ncbi:MAG: sugar phosphate nucleotidyltransferase [Brevinematales bacterium]|nr:sugar phosphate nucleotidyltransferase [Brevinematales bacterium]
MRVLILCGGKGRTLWPISRDNLPKQFSKEIFGKSLFQSTLEMWSSVVSPNMIVAIAPQENRFFVISQSIEVFKTESVQQLVEPRSQGTLKAVSRGILHLIQSEVDKYEIVVVSNSDQIWKIDISQFSKTLNSTINKLPPGKVLMISTSKSQYLRDKIEVRKDQGVPFRRFVGFSDKSRMFNIGLYISSVVGFRDLIQNAYSKSIESIIEDEYLDGTRFEDVLVKMSNEVLVDDWGVEVVDIDSIDNVSDLLDKDDKGNYIKGDVIINNSKNITAISTKRLIAVDGLQDVNIIETPDVVYVGAKRHSTSIMDLIKGREEVKYGVTEYRPWGSYTVIDKGENYQIKRIVVNPGEKLSLQLHYHRSEHWVVIKGTAKVTIGDNVIFLRENESTFIPKTVKHRLENPGKIPLEIIEIQIGDYISEDDIVRFSDLYGRSQ